MIHTTNALTERNNRSSLLSTGLLGFVRGCFRVCSAATAPSVHTFVPRLRPWLFRSKRPIGSWSIFPLQIRIHVRHRHHRPWVFRADASARTDATKATRRCRNGCPEDAGADFGQPSVGPSNYIRLNSTQPAVQHNGSGSSLPLHTEHAPGRQYFAITVQSLMLVLMAYQPSARNNEQPTTFVSWAPYLS